MKYTYFGRYGNHGLYGFLNIRPIEHMTLTYVKTCVMVKHVLATRTKWNECACSKKNRENSEYPTEDVIAISFRSGPLVHVHVHFRELKIGSSIIGMLQGLSACYMVCNALILFGCFCKELHEALSSKLHQWLHAALAAWCAICIKYLRHTF